MRHLEQFLRDLLGNTKALSGALALATGIAFTATAGAQIGVHDAACTPLANSKGRPASLTLFGTGIAGDDIKAVVTDAVTGFFGYYHAGFNFGLSIPPGASGLLCIGDPLFTYNDAGLGHVFKVDALGGGGPTRLQTDGSFAPVPAFIAGDTVHFQALYRDVAGTWNYTDSISVSFL